MQINGLSQTQVLDQFIRTQRPSFNTQDAGETPYNPILMTTKSNIIHRREYLIVSQSQQRMYSNPVNQDLGGLAGISSVGGCKHLAVIKVEELIVF